MKKPNYIDMNKFANYIDMNKFAMIVCWYEDPDGNSVSNKLVYTSFGNAREAFINRINYHVYFAIDMFRCKEDTSGGIVEAGDPIMRFNCARINRKLRKKRKRKAR